MGAEWGQSGGRVGAERGRGQRGGRERERGKREEREREREKRKERERKKRKERERGKREKRGREEKEKRAQIFLPRGRLRLVGSPLDSLNVLHMPPRPYLREYAVRGQIGQTHLMVCRIRRSRIITSPCSLSRWRSARSDVASARSSDASEKSWLIGCSLNWTSHLVGAGEPSGATRPGGPGGAPPPLAARPERAPRRPWTAPKTIPGAGRGLSAESRDRTARSSNQTE